MERLRELAELAKKLFPSKAREETGSYNYQEVANPELRQYLEKFDEGVVQRIGPLVLTSLVFRG